MSAVAAPDDGTPLRLMSAARVRWTPPGSPFYRPARIGSQGEDDDATQGCLSWLQGWCEGSQAAPRDITVMARVGARAIWLMRQGVPRAELQRLMWAGGRDHDTYGEADACSG